MSTLISLYLFGFCIPTVVVSQFNGLPRLDPNGNNVCEFARTRISYEPTYAHPNPDPANRQRRRRRRQTSSEEEGPEDSGSSFNRVNKKPGPFTDVWSSQVVDGASYRVRDVEFGSEPMITDIFDYGCCPGWNQEDNACTIALCDSPCLYGKCTSPNTCTCSRGWTGSTCNEKCKPGESSGDCGGPYVCDPNSHECQCLPGYTGKKCNVPCPVGTYGPSCEGQCQCEQPMNEQNTCDRYTGECPVIVDATQQHHVPTQTGNKTKEKIAGVPSIDLVPTTVEPAQPRTIVHEALSTMKIVFLAGVSVTALVAIIAGLIFRRRRNNIVKKSDSFFERKKAWGALVITELNEVNERRRRARQAEQLTNEESVYDNPPTPPSRRHTYLDSLMDTLELQRTNYAGLREPDGQDATVQGTAPRTFATLHSDVKPITVPQEDESIYEVHECGASSACGSLAPPTTRMDSIYANDNVFSAINRCKMDNSLLTPVANAIDNIETESEYDYPYTDMTNQAGNYGSATEPRQNRRKRFGSRDRRMRKGSSDGQMYSVLIRPDIEAVSYQKQSYSDNLDNVGYASKIERIDEPTYELERIDSSTDLYSPPSRVLIGNSWYDKPRGSSHSSYLDVPPPDDTYSDFIRDPSGESSNRFALGYLTSVRKMPSIQVTPSPTDPTKFDYQPPEADHYQSYQCNSVIQRNLFRHQFQTVHNRPDKPTKISLPSSKLERPNCLPIPKYHDYVNGKMISTHGKPPLPRRKVPPLPASRALQGEGAASPLAASNGFPSPGSNSSYSPGSNYPSGLGDFLPSPNDLDSDNYLSLRFSEKARPMKTAANI